MGIMEEKSGKKQKKIEISALAAKDGKWYAINSQANGRTTVWRFL